MTNAVKKIVRTYFGKPEISIDGLMEILETTGNADVALDILLGTYQAPDLPEKSIAWAGYDCTFVWYDKWTDEVHFTYFAPSTKSYWVDKSVDISTLNAENIKQYHSHSGTKHVSIPTSEPVEQRYHVSSKDWIEGFEHFQREEAAKDTASSNDVTPTSAGVRT